MRVNRGFLARFPRLCRELPGLATDVQKALLESSSRPKMLLYLAQGPRDGRRPPLRRSASSSQARGQILQARGWVDGPPPQHQPTQPCVKALTRPLLGCFLPIFTDFSDFLGRLRPSKTTVRKTLNTLGVEESSSPRRVLDY